MLLEPESPEDFIHPKMSNYNYDPWDLSEIFFKFDKIQKWNALLKKDTLKIKKIVNAFSLSSKAFNSLCINNH